MLTLVGPYVNGTAVAVGGLAGAFLGAKLPERLRVALPQTFGLASMALGVSMPAINCATRVRFSA